MTETQSSTKTETNTEKAMNPAALNELLMSLSVAVGGSGREFSVPEDEVDDVFKTVHISTRTFDADALPLYQMPGLQVLEIMLIPYEPVKMARMVDLFKTALASDRAVEQLGLVSMHELSSLLNQWVDKSHTAESELDLDE